jgi:hypothetical protein
MPMRYAPGASFDPQVAIAMSEAFHSAWDVVKAAPDMADGKADWAKETLALRIIETAQRGEHNVARMREEALAYLANANKAATGLATTGV